MRIAKGKYSLVHGIDSTHWNRYQQLLSGIGGIDSGVDTGPSLTSVSSRLPEGEGACRWSTRLPSFLPHILQVAFHNHAKSTRIIEKEKGAYEGDKRGLQGEEKEGIISRR